MKKVLLEVRKLSQEDIDAATQIKEEPTIQDETLTACKPEYIPNKPNKETVEQHNADSINHNCMPKPEVKMGSENTNEDFSWNVERELDVDSMETEDSNRSSWFPAEKDNIPAQDKEKVLTLANDLSNSVESPVRIALSYLQDGIKETNDISNQLNLLSGGVDSCQINDENTDIRIYIGTKHIKAHKWVLESKSNYFKKILCTTLFPDSKNIRLSPDIPRSLFIQIIECIYSGKMILTNQNIDQVLRLLCLTNLFQFTELERSIQEHIRINILSIDNVCKVYKVAFSYEFNILIEACMFVIDTNTSIFLQSAVYTHLTAKAFTSIISRDLFSSNEIDIFYAIVKWLKANPTVPLRERDAVLQNVRLTLISKNDLHKIVRPTKIYDPDEILNALERQDDNNMNDTRGGVREVRNENIATHNYGATLVQGIVIYKNLLSTTPEIQNAIHHAQSYTYHDMDDEENNAIVVKLGGVYLINHIRLHLYENNINAYSFYMYDYFIEVSEDKKCWIHLAKYSNETAEQDLHFKDTKARFIRLVGTKLSPPYYEKFFKVVSLEVYLSSPPDNNRALLERHFSYKFI